MFLSRLLPATAVALSLSAGSAFAASQSFDLSFQIDVVAGDRQDLVGQTILGNLTVDTALLDPSGDGITEGADNDLTLNFFGQTLTEEDDVDFFGDFPRITFVSFVPISVNILFEDASITSGSNPIVFDDPDILGLDLQTLVTDNAGVYEGSAAVLSVGVVPLPAGLPLLAAGAGALALLRRRKAAS